MQKKILFVFCFFCFLFLFNLSEVKCAFEIEYNGETISLPDLPVDISNFDSNYFSVTYWDGTYHLLSYYGYNPDTMYVCTDDGVSGYMGIMTSNGAATSARFKRWTLSSGSWVFDSWQNKTASMYGYYSRKENSKNFRYSTVDLYYGTFTSNTTMQPDLNNILFKASTTIPEIILPFVSNTEESLTKNNFQDIFVNPGSIPSSDTINFSIRNNEYLNLPEGASFVGYMYSIDLNNTSSYYRYNQETGTYYYQIPKSDLPIYKGNDKESYSILLFYDSEDYSKYVETNFSIDITTDEEKELENLNETNKGILSGIGDIFALLNPLDFEHFFLYQAIGRLFTPADNFFNTWLSDMNEWLGDRFGLIYYPIELLIDFLTRIGDIEDTGSYILSWGNLDIFGSTLISAGQYDFNSLLTNDTFKNIHNIYLMFMDVIFYLLLVLYAKNAAAEVFGGRFDDQVIGNIRNHIENNKPSDAYHKTKIGFRKG